MLGSNTDASSFTAVDNTSNNGAGGMPSAEERRVLQWIAQLMDPATREAALLELSKKREQFPQLALILWHSFGQSCSYTTLSAYATDAV